MKDKRCGPVRRELEERMLNEDFSTATVEHLQTCADCREFQRQQTKLRQIVGGLDTVSAPADFDFRLRARLAAESQEPSFRFRTFAVKGLATAAVLVVFGVGAVVVWQRTHEPAPVVAEAPPQVVEPPQVATPPGGHEEQNREAAAVRHQATPAAVADNTTRRRRSERAVAANGPTRVATIDSSSERAPRFNNTHPVVDTTTMFPIEASSQSVKVSLDDGRGNARTISFPTVSFGSQRVPTTANQLAPKGAW
jgi:hypothetical protein